MPILYDTLNGRYYPTKIEPGTGEKLKRIRTIIEQSFGKKSVEMARYYYEIAYQNAVYHNNSIPLKRLAAFTKDNQRRANSIMSGLPDMAGETEAWNLLLAFKNLPRDRKHIDGPKMLTDIAAINATAPLSDLLMGRTYWHLAVVYSLMDQERCDRYIALARSHKQPISNLDSYRMLPLKVIAAPLPDALKEAGFSEGFVKVRFTITKFGKVIFPEVIERDGPEALEKAALNTVKDFRYKPFKLDDRAINLENVVWRFAFSNTP